MTIYHKIPSPFLRDNETKKLTREYISPEVEGLANSKWIFTDKVDGTNVRVYWDGYNLEFKGRTEKAELPKILIEKLKEIFIEELIEQKFGDTPVIFYGEGYGGKIQKGKYETQEDFILFDVRIGKVFLERHNLEDISKSLNLNLVPIELEGTIQDAIFYLTKKDLVEGLVGVPKGGYLNRKGERIIIKIKNRDFTTN